MLISNEGRALIISAADLPELSKGKGNQLIGISSKAYKDGIRLQHLINLSEGGEVALHSGRQKMYIKHKDYAQYLAARGHKGQFLPKGYRNVERITDLNEDNNA